MSDKRETILSGALKLFNEKGIDEVKTRDIAKGAGISLGNLTYYFPTKSDLVLALTQQVAATIDEALEQLRGGKNENSLLLYHKQVMIIFEAQLQYKFLFIRYGEVITSFPQVQLMLQEILGRRFQYWEQLNLKMVEEGLAGNELLRDTSAHSYVINMLALFWHQELAIYFPGLSDKQKMQKAVAIYFQSYKPYLTAKGLGVLSPLLIPLEQYAGPTDGNKM